MMESMLGDYKAGQLANNTRCPRMTYRQKYEKENITEERV